MNLTLTRKQYSAVGVFSELSATETGAPVASTLEHAYEDNQPKIPPGTYTCKRGMHRLHGMTQDFEAFEILSVPGHTGVLFHVGNKNSDSEGCVCLGLRRSGDMVLGSQLAFGEFMALQKGVDEFTLTVV